MYRIHVTWNVDLDYIGQLNDMHLSHVYTPFQSNRCLPLVVIMDRSL